MRCCAGRRLIAGWWVGGAVLTPELAAAIGAHAYARDAMDTVRFARENA